MKPVSGSTATGWSQHLPLGAIAATTAHGLRMLASLVVIKMIAVSLGPEGLGAIGNLISVLSVVMVFAGGGIANGITKYAAQYQNRARSTLRLLETAFALGFSVSGIVLMLTVIAARPFAMALFGAPELWWLSPLLGLAHFACFIGTATIAVANGHQRSDLFAVITIIAYLACIPIAFLLIHFLGFPGAAMALMTMAGCTALPALYFLLRAPVRRLVRFQFHRRETIQLLRFSAMTLTSALAFPICEVLIRSTIIERIGLADAGIWQAAIRLSGAIIGFCAVYLATSYMPRLSALTNPVSASRFVRLSLLQVGAAFLALAAFIFLLRRWIIPLLFSEAFTPLEPLLGWQLAGDFFRICSYVIGFLVVARAQLTLHIAAELIQYSIYLCISLSILYAGGSLEAVIQGYAATYFLYFVIAICWLETRGKFLQ